MQERFRGRPRGIGHHLEPIRPLLAALYVDMKVRRLQPKTVVQYRRVPFVYGPGNVRVTIDWDIRTGAPKDFLDPKGLTLPIEDDAANISVGERQLLTIARAFVADLTILILDEATSSVDTRTELLIQKAMHTLRQGRTGFIIAHRLSTIRDADIIVVMKDGGIVEVGNHDELIRREGAYRELYQSQFELPLD